MLFDLDVVIAIAERQGCSLYEAEDQLKRLLSREEDEEE